MKTKFIKGNNSMKIKFVAFDVHISMQAIRDERNSPYEITIY